MQNSLAHPFFTQFAIEALSAETFDRRLAEVTDQLAGVFFWGHDCPNCEVAKAKLFDGREKLGALGFKWFHVNVYENSELGVRFGLHGIPTFIFFRESRRLGKITPFPGLAPFMDALEKLKRERD